MRDAKSIIQAKIDSENHDIKNFSKVYEILSQFEGQKYTWRLIKKMKTALENAGFSNVEIGSKHSWQELELFDSRHPATSSQGKYVSENGTRYILWYNSEATGEMTLKFFRDRNTWASIGAPERVAKLKKELKSVATLQAIDSLQNLKIPNLVDTLEELKKLESWHEIKQENAEAIKEIVHALGGRV